MMDIGLSDKWIRKVYREDTLVDNHTFCGAIEAVWDQLCFRWKQVSTQKKNISLYENKILPLLENHNERTISEYTYDDYEKVIQTIKDIGYEENGEVKFYDLTTINNIRNLIYYVVFYSSKLGMCENILFGTRFTFDIPSVCSEKEEDLQKLVLRKSLGIRDEKKLAKLLLSDVCVKGEWIAILLMYALGCRNGEACGLNYGDIRRLNAYPEVYVAWIYKSTKPHSSVLQSSGKTRNAVRIVPIPSRLVKFIMDRRKRLEEYLNEIGMTESIVVDDLPIACKGWFDEGDSFSTRLSAENITASAAEIFEELGIDSKLLSCLDTEISENGLADLVNEKNPTAYLLRRNFATHLQILGLEIHEIQYLIGHDVEDAYQSRNSLSDEKSIYKMAMKMSKRPLLNDIGDEASTVNIKLKPNSEVHIFIESNEYNDEIKTEYLGDEFNKSVLVKSYVNMKEKDFGRIIDVTNVYHRLYE